MHLPFSQTPQEQEIANRQALMAAISDHGLADLYNLKQLSTLQLEALLEYGSPFAFTTQEYSDDRNFITGNKGRVHMGIAPEAGRDFRDWHDQRVMLQIGGYRQYKRVQMSSKDKTPEELKEDKIHLILDTIDDKYKITVETIRNQDMKQLVDICLNKYEISIRRILAAMLRIRGPENSQFPSISEACYALGVERGNFLSCTYELQERGIYTREKIVENHEVIIEQIYNLLYDLHHYHGQVFTLDLISHIREEVPQAFGYLEEHIRAIRTNKAIPVALMLISRYSDLSPYEIFTPLMDTPDYYPDLLRTGINSFKNLQDHYPEFQTIDFNSTPRMVDFKNLFDNDHLNHQQQRSILYQYMAALDTIKVYNQQPLKLTLKLMARKPMTTTLICGMPGELYRSHLASLTTSSHQVQLLTDKSTTKWRNTTTSLRSSQYRLQIADLPITLEIIKTDQNFEALRQAMNHLRRQESAYKLIISDIRPYLKPTQVGSDLELSLKEALYAKSTEMVSEHHQTFLLRSQLKEVLQQYKVQYQRDHDRIHNLRHDEINEDYAETVLNHHPHLRFEIIDELMNWIDDPHIRVGASFSSGLVTNQDQFYYNRDWCSDTDYLLDLLLWNIPAKKTVVAAEIGQIHKTRVITQGVLM